jgi:pimeloyl-ACP methyl ester carboxylesterase
MEDRAAQTITLRDGRTLGYAEYGDPNGKPLLWFHGFPGCRLDGKLVEEAAGAAGVRVIAPDRPGMVYRHSSPRAHSSTGPAPSGSSPIRSGSSVSRSRESPAAARMPPSARSSSLTG